MTPAIFQRQKQESKQTNKHGGTPVHIRYHERDRGRESACVAKVTRILNRQKSQTRSHLSFLSSAQARTQKPLRSSGRVVALPAPTTAHWPPPFLWGYACALLCLLAFSGTCSTPGRWGGWADRTNQRQLCRPSRPLTQLEASTLFFLLFVDFQLLPFC